MKTPDTVQDNKLVTYFKVVHPDQYKDFAKFIKYRLPKNKEVLSLFEYYCKQQPHFDSIMFTKERLARILNDPSSKKLETAIRALPEIIQNYLAHQMLDKQPLEKTKLIASALAERGDYSTFEKYVQQETTDIEERIQKAGNPVDTADFLALYTLNETLFFHPDTEKIKPVIDSLNKTEENLDKFYVLEKLRIVSDLLIRQKFLSNQVDIEISYLLALAKNYTEPVFRLYVQLIPLLQAHEDELFLQLLSDLKQNLPCLAPFDKSVFIHKLLYLSNKVYEKGKIEYLQYIFELSQIADEQAVTIYKHKIDYLFFINAVSVAAAVGRPDWARYFMKKYNCFLNPDSRVEIVELAETYCQFFEAQYPAVLDKVKKSGKHQHFVTRLQYKTIRLRVYYELIIQYNNDKYYEIFERHCDNLTRYLQRDREKKLSEDKQQAIKNFITVLQKFIKYFYNHNHKVENSEHLKAKLLAMDPIIAKAWLVKKIDHLILIKRGIGGQ